MQSNNVVVVYPAFMLVFLGTALVSVIVAIASVAAWSQPGAGLRFAGAMVLSPDSVDASAMWSSYVEAWTRWNSVRTAAAFVARTTGESQLEGEPRRDRSQRRWRFRVRCAHFRERDGDVFFARRGAGGRRASARRSKTTRMRRLVASSRCATSPPRRRRRRPARGFESNLTDRQSMHPCISRLRSRGWSMRL